MAPTMLYVHASYEGGVFVVRADGTQAWITAPELDAEVERLASDGGSVLISLEGGQGATPAAHALHRRIIGAVPTRVMTEEHPAVTPLPEGVTRLMAFAHAGRDDLVADVLARGAQVDVRDQQGTTPLMYAANSGQADVVRVLLEAKADPDAFDVDDTTALMFAARGGHLEVVRVLLEHGADPTAAGAHGLTALDVARDEGHDLVIAVLRQATGR